MYSQWGPSFATTPQQRIYSSGQNPMYSFGPPPSQAKYIGQRPGGGRYQAWTNKPEPFRFGMAEEVKQNQSPYVRNAAGSYVQRQTQQGGQQSQNPVMDALNVLTGATNNIADIQTSITPQGVYSPQQTQEATNQAVASQQQMANLPWLQGRYARPGMSQASPAIASRALPDYGAALAGAQQARVDIPFQDTRADAANILAGQTAREGEAIDWYRILSALGGANRGAAVNESSALLNMLTAAMA
jgi:hypothetical protein